MAPVYRTIEEEQQVASFCLIVFWRSVDHKIAIFVHCIALECRRMARDIVPLASKILNFHSGSYHAVSLALTSRTATRFGPQFSYCSVLYTQDIRKFF